MAHHEAGLDTVFLALADPTRRAVLDRLAEGPASVGELARPFAMALPSFMKHIRLLEESGWIATRKRGRVRTCTLQRRSLAAADAWLGRQRAVWEGRTDRLERLVAELQEKEERE